MAMGTPGAQSREPSGSSKGDGMKTGFLLVVWVLVGAVAAVAGGELVWDRELRVAGATQAELHALLAVDDVVVAAGRARIEPLDDWVVFGLDARTGETLWQDVDTVASEAFAAAAGGGRLHVVGSLCAVFDRCDGLIRTYESSSGEILWEDRFDLSGLDTIATVARLDHARLFVLGEKRIPARDGFVRAYDAATGALLWQQTWKMANDPYVDAGPIGASVAGGRLILASNDWLGGNLNSVAMRAYDAASGALLWAMNRPPEGTAFVSAQATIGDMAAAVGSSPDLTIWAVDARNGHTAWQVTNGHDSRLGLSAADRQGRRLLVAGTFTPLGVDDEYVLRAHRASDGHLLWDRRISVSRSDLFPRMTVSGKSAYTLGLALENPPRQSQLVARATRVGTGRVRWTVTVPIDGGPAAEMPHPAVGAERVFAGVSYGSFRVDDREFVPYFRFLAFGRR